jgi:hypothetical protein
VPNFSIFDYGLFLIVSEYFVNIFPNKPGAIGFGTHLSQKFIEMEKILTHNTAGR